ncbi:MAG: protein TolQ [Desulfobacterales bacterium]|nr:protein TolQ [Desulfobacterales bacterium]
MTADLDLIQMISGAGIMVQMVLLLLLFFSITSWAIMLMKYRYLKCAFRESALFSEFFWKSRDLSEAYKKAKQLQGSPIARVFRVGYVELNQMSRSTAGRAENAAAAPVAMTFGNGISGTDNVKRALRRAINTEMTRMAQMVPFLATTGNTTPFIGLFGTVWGIMNSFHGIGLRGSASLAVVAPGISEALVATAAGLAAAIPAVIAFNHFSNRIRLFEAEMQNFSADFLNIVERDILQSEGGRR